MKKLITMFLMFIMTLTTFSQTVQKYKVTGIRSNVTTAMKDVQSFEIAIIDSTFKIGEISYTIKTITVISVRMVTEFESVKVSYLCLKM